MLIFLLFFSVHSEETISFLATGSEFTIEGHAGVKLINGKGNCRIGTFNTSMPFGICCRDFYPLYVDDSRRTHFGADVLTEANLEFKKKLVINKVDQWALIHFDVFETTEADGWSNSTVTSCGGVRMLGGYCQFSAGTTWKEFLNLPEHEEVRIKAVWHFIDEWRGETGFMELGTSADTNVFWALTYDITSHKNPINMCGDSDIGEGKFSSTIDIQFKHDTSDLLVTFGSTLEEQPCEKSWGISGFEVYIR